MRPIGIAASLLLYVGASACTGPLSPFALAVVDDSGGSLEASSPPICDFNEFSGDHVLIIRSCDGTRFFIPYEISSDSTRFVIPHSLVLKDSLNQLAIFIIDLSITRHAFDELRTISTQLGATQIHPYPASTTDLVPITYFPNQNSFSLTAKDNLTNATATLNKTLIIQIAGSENISSFSKLLTLPNGVSLAEHLSIPDANGELKRISILVRIGNLRETNLTR